MAGGGGCILASEKEMMAEEAERLWADLASIDVLHLVALHLPPPDLSNFQKVCKLWRSIPIESYPLGPTPLLFSYHLNNGDKLHYYSPLYDKIFSLAASRKVLDIFKSPASCLMYSKDGWLVFFNYDEQEHKHPAIVFVNPLLPSAAAVIEWDIKRGMVEYCKCHSKVSMSAPPTDPACIFLITDTFRHGIEIITVSDGGRNWKVDFFRYRPGFRFFTINASPIFHGGVFYCVGAFRTDERRWGSLGIYNPYRRTWAQHYLGITIGEGEFFLVESDRELLGVFKSEFDMHTVNYIVYKLNESSMEWEHPTELEGRSFYLGHEPSFSVVAEVEWMKDRIFYHFYDDTARKADCELLRLAGGCRGIDSQWVIPKHHLGLAESTTTDQGEEGEELVMTRHYTSYPYSLYGRSSLGRSSRYSPDGTTFDQRKGEEQESEEQAERKEFPIPTLNIDLMFTTNAGIWVQPNWGQ